MRCLIQFLKLNWLKFTNLKFEITLYHSLIDYRKLLFMINSVRSNSYFFMTLSTNLYFFLKLTREELIWLKTLSLNFKTPIKSLLIILNQRFLFLSFSFQLMIKGFLYLNSILQFPQQFHFCFPQFFLIIHLFSIVS